MKRLRYVGVALMTLALLSSVGCYRMTILSSSAGKVAAETQPRSGTVISMGGGLIDVTGAISLAHLCPSGWNRIELAVTPFDSLMSDNSANAEYQSFWVYCNRGGRVGALRDQRGRVVKVFRPAGSAR